MAHSFLEPTMENAILLHVYRLSLFVWVSCFWNFDPHGTELLL